MNIKFTTVLSKSTAQSSLANIKTNNSKMLTAQSSLATKLTTFLNALYTQSNLMVTERSLSIAYILQCTLAIMLSTTWLLSGAEVQAQNNVGIGTTTPNSKAILELQAVDKGFLAPRLTTAQMNGIATPPNGLLVYNTTTNCFYYYNSITISWKNMCSLNATGNDTLVLNLVQIDSLFAHYIKTDTLLSHTIITNYLKADSAYINYLRADSIYSLLIKADSAFIKSIFANTLTAHYITTDSLYAHLGRFDSLYVGGKNITNIITDSIAAQAWLLKGNNTSNTAKLGTLNARDLHIVANSNERITIANGTGNVGIGQTLPSAKLDVLGDVQFSKDLKPAGNPGTTGDLLVSQGTGNAPTWVAQNTIVPITTVSNAYNTTTGTLNTTVNGITGANVTLPTSTAVGDSVRNLAWLLNGNAGTTAGTNFIGTTDNQDVVFKRNGVQSGLINSILLNTSFGFASLNPTTTGNANTALGIYSLSSNTSGVWNVAVGESSLASNTTGASNTAIGTSTLRGNTIGGQNTAIGIFSLGSNISGSANTAVGESSMNLNTIGQRNTAIGVASLISNNTGNYNVASGAFSLKQNTTGNGNTAMGGASMDTNTVGNFNSAFGYLSLYNNDNGNNNTSIGYNSGYTITTGSNNTFLGAGADVTLNNLTNATAIGYNAKVGASNAMVLGGTGANAVNVGINTTTPIAKLDVNGYTVSRNNVITPFYQRGNTILLAPNAPTGAYTLNGTGSVTDGSMTSYIDFSNTTSYVEIDIPLVAQWGLNGNNFYVAIAGYWANDVLGGAFKLEIYDNTTSTWVTLASGLVAGVHSITNPIPYVSAGVALPKMRLTPTLLGGTGFARISEFEVFSTLPYGGYNFAADKIQVNTALKITDGTQGAGKVLTSDATGNASWQGIGDVVYANNLSANFALNVNGTWRWAGSSIILPPGLWEINSYCNADSPTGFNHGYFYNSWSTTQPAYTQATWQARVNVDPQHIGSPTNVGSALYSNSTGGNVTIYFFVNLTTNAPFDPNAFIGVVQYGAYAKRIK